MNDPQEPEREVHRPVVGLFGYYSAGNWGDDLMARVFAQLAGESGADARVFTTNPDSAYFAGLTTLSDPAKFVEASDVLIYGGGGILSTAHDDESPFARAIDSILSAAHHAGKDIHVLSIGGSGSTATELPRFVSRLIRTAGRVTVRNRRDLDTIQQHRDDAECHEDVLWLLPRLQHLSVSGPRRPTVAINLTPRGRRWFERAGYWMFRVVRHLRPGLRFVFIESQQLTREAPDTALHAGLSSPEADAALLAEIDLIVSGRLHLGLVCLAYGKPFLSVFGHPKTRLMFENIGQPEFCLSPWSSMLLPLRFLSRRFTNRALQPIRFAPSEFAESAEGHARIVRHLVAAIGR